MTGKEIRDKLGIQQVAAVQKLPSGDLRVLIHREQEKTKMEDNQGWLQTVWPEAVLVHGIRTSWDITDKASWKKMEEENLSWFPHLRIERAVWLKSPKAREGQRHSTAIISVQDKATAQAIASKGFVLEANFHPVEAYHPQQRAVQCLKCNRFGHMSTYCRETTDTCGTCAGNHRTSTCSSKQKKCSNCRGDHPSWSRVCKYKQAALAKAKAFTAYFQRGAEQKPTMDKEGYTIISHNKKRKPSSTPEQLQEGETTSSQDNQRATTSKPPGKPRGSNQVIIAGRKQANKLTAYTNSQQPQQSQPETQTEADLSNLMDTAPDSQDE